MLCLWYFSFEMFVLKYQGKLFLMMQVTSILSFAASCSAGGVVVLFDRDAFFCSRDPHLPCGAFELATAFAFLSWALSATSALVMFWLLASP
jgi:hypothetical protein